MCYVVEHRLYDQNDLFGVAKTAFTANLVHNDAIAARDAGWRTSMMLLSWKSEP